MDFMIYLAVRREFICFSLHEYLNLAMVEWPRVRAKALECGPG
jgi:hypothetical protein